MTYADYTTAAAPAAPGAAKGRFYVVTGDRPGYRAGAAGAAEELSVTTHTTPAMTATVAGHVPTPPNNTTTFLRGDGTFAVAPGTGAPAGAEYWVNALHADLTAEKLMQTVRKTADESVTSSTTLQDDDALLFNVTTGEAWAFMFILRTGGAQAGDIAWAVKPSLGANSVVAYAAIQHAPGATAIGDAGEVRVNDGGVGSIGAGVISTTADPAATIVIVGTVDSATTGTIKLQWAQNVSNTTATVVKAGSVVIAWRTS